MKTISDLNIKIFLDSADKKTLLEMHQQSFIKGFTTNPTIMRKAGVSNYADFARNILTFIQNKPISFEVFSDDFSEMFKQAQFISSWGQNVYVKIPITNTQGHSACELIRTLAKAGVKQNVTALLTLDQVFDAATALAEGPSACISVFAGRIADSGIDPEPPMRQTLSLIQHKTPP